MSEPVTPRGSDIAKTLEQDGYRLVETHISSVLMDNNDVYKIKKPVDFGFLDFTSLKKRRAACLDEVRLNRRLANDVYKGVDAITLDGDGVPVIGGPGEAVEWAVHMRRLNDAHRADTLLAAGQLKPRHIEQLAETLARFHETCSESEATRHFGSTEVIRRNVIENFEQTRDFIGEYVDADIADEIEHWQLDFLEARSEHFAERVASGRVRDGHGDLRLEHVYFEPAGGGTKVTVLDCIEFNERFRYADVCADVAFLAMDLAESGAPGLAEQFLADYARSSNDYGLYRLIDFYQSYRAFVRGKVLGMTLEGGSFDHQERARLETEARRHFLLSHASERRPIRPPVMVCVGGWIASGKSTVAEHLARHLDCPVITADLTRKSLLGRAPTESLQEGAFTGAYSAAMTAQVYSEMLRRAEAVMDSGRSVVLDATFRDKRNRAVARRLAAEHNIDFLFLECVASAEVCKERLSQRNPHRSVSDGRLEIFDDFVDSWESVTEMPPSVHLRLDTKETLDRTLIELFSLMASRTEQLRA